LPSFEERKKAIAEMVRVLKIGGKFIVQTSNFLHPEFFGKMWIKCLLWYLLKRNEFGDIWSKSKISGRRVFSHVFTRRELVSYLMPLKVDYKIFYDRELTHSKGIKQFSHTMIIIGSKLK
jgi:ubiquinone/menaquinone biosynthesis C-methylase UbiE